MPTPTKNRNHTKEERLSAARRKSLNPIAGKEFDYVLQLDAADTRLLKRYHDILTQGAAGFAETIYNYLFDNPDIADVMYAYERQGGDVGELVRGQLEHQLSLLKGDLTESATARSERLGRSHFQWGVKPVWSLGAYRLCLEHLKQLMITDPQIAPEDREPLESALVKMVFRDLAITSEAYWRATVEQLKSQRDELGFQQNLAGEILSHIPQLLWTVDIEANRISYASPGTRAFCDDKLEAPIPCFFRISGSERQRVLTAWQQVIDNESVQLEVRVEANKNEERWFRMAFYPSANRRGRVLRVHCLMEDVTDLHTDRERLEQLSTQDEVTGLANRTLWYDRLASALAVARRNPGASVAVMVLDINQFKMYNDSLGHKAGDVLLRQIAERLQKVLRDTDTLSRLGGDEFGIILPMVQDAEKAAARVATEVMNSLSAPFSYRKKELCLSSTIGIAIFPQHGEDAHTLASHADSAMYRAKWNSAPYLFYEIESADSASEHLQFSGQLHGALERKEFELYYQPKIDLSSGELRGAEALLRWQHPQQGMVLPKQFIPVAEQLGMISPITDWVLDTALRQCKGWLLNDGKALSISINVSARSFQSPGLVDRIAQALTRAGVDGSCLELEITEETLMADVELGAGILANLSQLGVSIAIDDFGTGYSSLSYLKRLPIDVLKIDQSFLEGMANNPKDVAIVRSIIELGHNLNCKVVAEGVEAETVQLQLQELGCDLVQGFHISKPLPDAGFREWMSLSTH